MAAGLLLLLTACEDPSNVGIGLVGVEGGEPVTVSVEAMAVDTASYTEVTGNAARVLAGRVDDPLFGALDVAGYVDFQAIDAANEDYRDRTITAATLRLVRQASDSDEGYLYGDSLSTVTLALRDMPDEWSAANASPDTTIAAAPEVVTEVSFQANQAAVEVSLPDTWVAANDTTLRSAQFASSFHGFKLEPVSGGAVVGFSASQSRLVAYTEQDTVAYVTGTSSTGGLAPKTLTGITRRSEPNLPPNRTMAQDGAEVGVTFAFAFDTLAAQVVNGAAYRFYADTLTMQQNTPVNFTRPRLQNVQMFGIADDGEATFLTAANLDSQGRLSFSAPLLLAIVRSEVLGNALYDHYELRMLSSDNTINAALFFAPGTEEHVPEAALVTTPILE